MRVCCSILLPLCLAGLPALPAQAPPALAGMVPDDAIAVIEMRDPAVAVRDLIGAAGELPPGLREHLGVLGLVGLAGAWIAVDGDPVAFAAAMAGGGAVLAVVPHQGGLLPVLLLRPHDQPMALRWWQRFAAKVPCEAVDDVVVVAPERAVVARIAAAARGPARRWGSVDLGPAAAVRGALDLAAVRQLSGARFPTWDRIDAGARFLFLPWAHALFAPNANWVRVAVAGGERVKVEACVDASVRQSPLAALLAPPAAGSEVPLAGNGLATLRLERSLRTLLTTPERFLKPADVLAVQGFLSIADAIDGARTSFVDDLLGGLGEPFVLHVLPVTPPEDGAAPRLQLPGFALVARLVEPAAVTVLLRAAQALALIVNAERAQRDRPTFPLRARSTDRGRGLVAEPTPWRGPGAPPIEQALSPTLWCENGHVVLASTHAAAMAVVAATYEPRIATDPAPHGDRLVLRGPAWATAIATSRSVLELGRMLDEGEDAKAARAFFDVLLVLANAVGEIAIEVDAEQSRTTATLIMERAR